MEHHRRLPPVAEPRSLSFMTWIQTIVFGLSIIICAVLVLGFRDRARSKILVKQLRQKLSTREDCSDSELASVFPLNREKEIAVKFRMRLSKVLQVSAEKIHPDDDLHRDFHLDTIWPFLIAAIASEFTWDATKSGTQQVLTFRSESTRFRDFVRAISQQSA
jgi:hypothetical protein